LDEKARFASALTGALERSRLDALLYPAALSRPATQESGRARYGYEPGTCEESARTGLPVVTTPGGFLDDGRLPLGITLLGRPWSESRLLALAYAYEQLFHHHMPPPGSTRE
jgi:amidase